MYVDRRGAYRAVLLIERFAIKVPYIRWEWCRERSQWSELLKSASRALKMNINERDIYKKASLGIQKLLAKSFLVGPFGLFIVMEKCEVLSEEEFKDFQISDMIIFDDLELPYLSDIKAENLGWTEDGRLVVLDYGDSLNQMYSRESSPNRCTTRSETDVVL